ncbi:MAG: 2TM domain-containing protein [Oscillatoriales cyanobacterium SM2_2_1]|nr:2TM domain-containing protein [Oscillatoriales cyanobacterium SM2_2_1]
MSELYSADQVQQILQRALSKRDHLGDNLTREQVQEIASELGVSAADFLAAEQEWRNQQQEQGDRQEFDRYHRRKFLDTAVTLGVVGSFLCALNWLGDHRITWAVYPLLCFGFILTLKAWSTLQPHSQGYQRAYQKWLRDRKQKQFFVGMAQKVTTKLGQWLDP